MASFYKNYPYTEYNNQQLRDITINFKIDEVVKDPISTFLNYSVEFEQRLLDVAFNYYGDTNYHWLVAKSNNITDYYYDWLIPDGILQEIIVLDYGSIANAMSTTVYSVRQTSDPTDPYTNITVNPETATVAGINVGFYQPVDAYTAAFQQNEDLRDIFLINNNYTNTIEQKVNEIINQ